MRYNLLGVSVRIRASELRVELTEGLALVLERAYHRQVLQWKLVHHDDMQDQKSRTLTFT